MHSKVYIPSPLRRFAEGNSVVEVEGGETGGDGRFHPESGPFQDLPEPVPGVVAAMADVVVEGRHGPSRHGDDQPCAGPHAGRHVGEQARLVVHVFQDLRADGVGGPARQLPGRGRGRQARHGAGSERYL